MSFSIHMASDVQLDSLLNSNKRIPSWKVINTQSAREHKRIRQLQLHKGLLENKKNIVFQKKQQKKTNVVSKTQNKKTELKQDGEELEV